MPCYFFSCRLGPRIEVYRNQSRPLHVEDGVVHIRRRPGYRNVSVLVRRGRSSSPARRRYRSPSPGLEPQIIEVEPSESYQRRYRSPAPSPEPLPRQHYHSHFHHQAPAPVPAPAPAPAPAAAPPAPPPTNPLGERVDSLAARNAALEVEMRELRDQFRAARIREEMLPSRCGDCGYTAGACRCGVPRSAMRERRYSSLDGNVRFDGARDVNFEVRAPRWEGRQRVRWRDELDWD